MNKHSDPIDHLIKSCENGIIPTKFDILNAKDHLYKLKVDSEEAYKQRWIDAEVERAKLAEENKLLKEGCYHAIVAWAKINSRGDLYGLSLIHNPYEDHTLVPLYGNKEEFKAIAEKLKNA